MAEIRRGIWVLIRCNANMRMVLMIQIMKVTAPRMISIGLTHFGLKSLLYCFFCHDLKVVAIETAENRL